MTETLPSRDELASEYLDQLEFTPYPVQEEALLTWFSCEQGVLVCAPTGTGKTLIAESALFEALHTGKRAYYTTPLIALTEQKLSEMQDAAERWGFDRDEIGLVTGNRRVNPDARILVVVAEILFNRLLHPEQFSFDDVFAVVMDEFHSFNDRERGIVWEFTLGLLPEHVRLLLLSATVGNAYEFTSWLRRSNRRDLELVEGHERRVPLTYQWIGESLLTEQIEEMARGAESTRLVPALVFCFNRDECWNVAEQLKGKSLLRDGQQAALAEELQRYDWSTGAGPKLRQILLRGVGVHHAGVLPRYRRIVEELFQRKLLSVCVCTETLAAGINLPARSVVIPNLLKGPPGDKRLIDPSSAHQMFGRAGRPQFDTQGYVFALAHEDDVKISRWRKKYDQIPEDTKDPGLRKAKKALKKKMPSRRSNVQYWSETQFQKLIEAPPGKLSSRGELPWRLLAHMLSASSDVEPIRTLVGKRLMSGKQLENAQRQLDRMLLTLWAAGYVELDPAPPVATSEDEPAGVQDYRAQTARPTESLSVLLHFRGVNPLFGGFLLHQLGIADQSERMQAFESLLEMPGSVSRYLRIPDQEELPPGPLAVTRLDPHLLRLGLVSVEELTPTEPEEDEGPRSFYAEEKPRVLTLPEKLEMLFQHDFPGVHGVRLQPVWAAGELLALGGDFDQFVTSRRLQKQEGVLFRHLLRLILLIAEFRRFCPAEVESAIWEEELDRMIEQLSSACHAIDPSSTERTVRELEKSDDEFD